MHRTDLSVVKPRVSLFLGLLWASLFIVPSLGSILHSPLGINGTLLYATVAMPFLTAAYVFLPKTMHPLTESKAKTVVLAVVFIICLASAICVPLANANRIPGANVRDETLRNAVDAITHLKYPYYYPVSPTEPITPLPGGILISLPFVLLGSSAYLNFLWLPLFFGSLAKYLNSWNIPIVLLLSMILGSPVIIHELVSGSDLLSNALANVIVTFLVIRFNSLSGTKRIGLGVLAGVALAWRFPFLFIVPLWLSYIMKTNGWRAALKWGVLVGFVYAVVVGPFYLYDRAHFSPLHVARYANRFDSVIGHSGVVVPALVGIVALFLSTRRIASGFSLLVSCGIILSMPTVLGITLTILSLRRFEVGPYSNFGVTFIFFGAAPLLEVIAVRYGTVPKFRIPAMVSKEKEKYVERRSSFEE
jgi:hypothetical protein